MPWPHSYNTSSTAYTDRFNKGADIPPNLPVLVTEFSVHVYLNLHAHPNSHILVHVLLWI
jgi:hypothetical protein